MGNKNRFCVQSSRQATERRARKYLAEHGVCTDELFGTKYRDCFFGKERSTQPLKAHRVSFRPAASASWRSRGIQTLHSNKKSKIDGRGSGTGKYLILAAFFLSGASALTYEIVWIRPITTVFSSTIYVVSLILFAFMCGLAIGGRMAARISDRLKNPAGTYAYIEILIGVYGLLSIAVFNLLPAVFAGTGGIQSAVAYYLMQYLAILLLLLIPTSLMGATFPILSVAYARDGFRSGISELYTANNLGAVLGAILPGFFLIPIFGVKYTLIIAAISNLTAGLLVLGYFRPYKLKSAIPMALVIYTVLAFTSYNVRDLYTSGFYGLFKQDYVGGKNLLFYKEGYYGEVSVWEDGESTRRLVINGQGSSSTRFSDLRVSSLLGYLPLLISPSVTNALVIGFGTGATSGILSSHIVTKTVEIDPTVIQTAKYFDAINRGVLTNKRHQIVYDDARHYLLKTRESHGVIVNHPLDPFQSFSSLLFTKEFLDLARSRLKPDGLYVQWFPLYSLKPEEFKDYYRTFKMVFPYHVAAVNLRKGEEISYESSDKFGNRYEVGGVAPENGQELILIGAKQPFKFTEKELAQNWINLSDDDKKYLAMTGLHSIKGTLNLIIFKDEDMKDFAGEGTLITDDKPQLEFTVPLNRIKDVNYRNIDLVDDYLKQNEK